MSTWRTTPGSLLRIFHRALVSVLPAIEEARIPWKEPMAYDDWDAIAEVLFAQIVTRSLKWSLPEAEMEAALFPPYDAVMQDYSGRSVLSLRDAVDPSQILVFRSLTTRNSPFDSVEWLHVGRDGRAIGAAPIVVPLASDDVGFMPWRSGGWSAPVYLLEVPL